MESTRRRGNRGIEENTLAILDTSGFNKTAQYLNDDKIAFLQAVSSASIVPENGTAPTNKMFEAIFQILKNENSLDLIMASYQLLTELDKHFPRMCVSKMEKSESLSSSAVLLELAMVEEAWAPFTFVSDVTSSEDEAKKKSCGSLDPLGFHLLIEDLAKVANERKSEALETKSLRNMFLLQYLVNVVEGDFFPRNRLFKENMSWTLLRESLLNMLMGSRKIIYKSLIKDCLSILSELSLVHTEYSHDTRCAESPSEPIKNCNTAVAIALPEVEKCTCFALQKLLVMVMELDTSKKIADMQGLTTRADGVRTPALEIILDELTYNKDIICPFFQVFDEPKWKLEIIVQYFGKYIAKPSVRTRRSNGPDDDATFDGILKCLSNSSSTKSIIKKIGTEVAQLLLAHAFQAYLSLSTHHSVDGNSDLKDGVSSSFLVGICKNVISVFTCLGRTDEHSEILPSARAALFTAATILSTKL